MNRYVFLSSLKTRALKNCSLCQIQFKTENINTLVKQFQKRIILQKIKAGHMVKIYNMHHYYYRT